MHVLIVNDPLLETHEVFTASLSLDDETDRGHVQLNPISVSITIVDDDGNEHVVISDHSNRNTYLRWLPYLFHQML